MNQMHCQPYIKARGIRKSFSGLPVLNKVDLDLFPGEVLALIGPSGAGKTTMLRILNLLERPEGGILEVEGQTLSYLSPKSFTTSPGSLRWLRRRVGMVFQQYYLWPHLTVLQNIMEAPMRVNGVPYNDARSEAEALLEVFGLSAKSAHYPPALSGGQQQRVALARALAMRPQVLLLDEITSALDPERVARVVESLRLFVERGTAMVLATHDMRFARALSHRVMFLEHGRVVIEGPTTEVLSPPHDDRLSRFLQEEETHGK